MPQEDTPIQVGGGARPAGRRPRSGRELDLTGQVLGDFKVERLLGRGGMGEVYLARQVSLDRPIALKVLKAELLANPTYLARFEKEALSSARLNHPNIVHVYSFGSAETFKYIAMEYVEGTNLKDYLAKKGIPELPLALSIMRQAGQAIAAAGESGLVHRDIKPENLLLTRKGQVKVADFGLCRTTSGQKLELTQEGVTLGTPMYMSPEQVQGRELDHRSDLYSLGVTYYHLLAGSPPFVADTAIALALKHVREIPVSLAVHRPDLPAELVALVMKLLDKDPGRRYASAGEMLRDLSRIRESLSNPALRAAVSTELFTTIPNEESAPAPESRRRASHPEMRWGELGRKVGRVRLGRRELVVVLLLAVAAGLATGLRRRPPNLLSARSGRTEGEPASWMAPWEEVAAQPTPEAQYRYAQLEAPESERVAAWLAVPGRFPQARDWAAKAYLQLARTLFRQRDTAALKALGSQLERSSQVREQAIGRMAKAGVAALGNQPEEVLGLFPDSSFDRLDPALNELGLEIADFSRRQLGRSQPSVVARLNRLCEQLADALQIGPLIRLGLISLG